MDKSHPGLPSKQRLPSAKSANIPSLLPIQRTSPVNSGLSLPPKPRTPSPVNNSGPSLPPKPRTPSPVNNSGPSLPPKQRTPSPVDNNSDPNPLKRGGDINVPRSSRRLRQVCLECEHVREVDDTGLCTPCRLKLKLK